MPFNSRFGFGLALGLVVALSTPVVVPAISYGGGEGSTGHSLTAKANANWQTTPTQIIAAAAYQLSLSEDGQRLAALTTDNIWNPQTVEQVSSTVLPTESCIMPDGAVLSPDGTGYYSSYSDTGACLGDVQTGAFQKLLDQPFAYKMVKFSGDGNRLAIPNSQNKIQIFSKSQN